MKKQQNMLKLHAGIQQNHNQATLKVRKALNDNHNESVLVVKGKVGLVQKAFALILVLTLMFTQWGGTVGSAKAAQCSATHGQFFINTGQYKKALQEFTCLINAEPSEAEGYRGRIEAQLMLGQYSNALADHSRITAYVLPVHPNAKSEIIAGYTARLAAAPQDIVTLTGASFARWTSFDYPSAIHLLNRLLAVQPDNPFGNLFRGSSRLLHHASNKAGGIADLDYGIALAPQSPDVRFIVADAYTYGLPDPQRAFDEASLALDWGLDTPRVHAILATSYAAFGDELSAAAHIQAHFDLVITEYVAASTLGSGETLNLDLVPGRAYDIPVNVTAGETLSILTSSPDLWDSILILHAPDGTPVLSSDDYQYYYAGFEWVVPVTGTYHLQVTSFESIDTGVLVVTRD